MRTKITFLWFFCNAIFFSAQQNNNFEKLVNEEFGTLLESLLVDGKLDNDNAKAYLATVYGYNTDVNNYLQNANFSKNLNSINSTNLNTLQYVELVNSSLLNAIPNQKFQQLSQNISDGLMFYNGIYDITQGNITNNAIGMGVKVFDFFSDLNRMLKEEEKLKEKIKIITPTLEKLSKNNINSPKLKITEDFSSADNWNVNKEPAFTKYSTYIITTNYTEIKDNHLNITSQNYNSRDWLNLGISKEVVYEKARLFRNVSKFDFSKDFRITMDLKIDLNTENDVFYIYIGKGYYISIQKYNKWVLFGTPAAYDVTYDYGRLENLYPRKKEIKDFDKAKGIYRYSGLGGESVTYEHKKIPEIDFNGILTLEIIKKGSKFSGKLLNDHSGSEFTVDNITYFPDKYYLGFKLKALNKNAKVEIHRLELEHL